MVRYHVTGYFTILFCGIGCGEKSRLAERMNERAGMHRDFLF